MLLGYSLGELVKVPFDLQSLFVQGGVGEAESKSRQRPVARPDAGGTATNLSHYPIRSMSNKLSGMKVQIHPNGHGFVSEIEPLRALRTGIALGSRLTNHFQHADAS